MRVIQISNSFLIEKSSMKDVESIADVLFDGVDGVEVLPVLVGEFEHKFLLQHVDDFHVIERIQAEIVDEVGIGGQLIRVDLVEELVGEGGNGDE